MARLLLDAIDDTNAGSSSDGATRYAGVSPDEVLRAASHHKIAPAVYVHLKRSGDIAPAIVDALRGAYRLQAARQMQIGLDLAWLARVMDALDVPWAVMKGPVLSEKLWSRPDIRQFADLDIVVSRHSLVVVLDALEAEGGRVIETDWPAVRRQMRGELSVLMPGATALDLHWHVVNSPQLRQVFRFPIEQMLRRTIAVRIGGVEVPTFDAADTLLHLAYHTVHSGGHRLVWLKDVERAALDPALDWDVLGRRALEYGLELALAVVLDRTDRTLDVIPRPKGALRVPRGGLWRAACRVTDVLWSAPVLPGDRLSGQIMYKSLRATTGQSLRAALSAVRHGKRSRLGRGAPVAPEVSEDHMRDDYLRLVTGHEEP